MITATETSSKLITSLVLIAQGTVNPTLSALKSVLDGSDITLHHDPETDMLDTEPTATSIPWHLTIRRYSRQEQDLIFKELDCKLYLYISDPRESEDAMRWTNHWGQPLKEFRRQLREQIREEVILLWQ